MRLVVLFALLFEASSAICAPRGDVESIIRRLMRDGEVPGLSIVVIHDRRIAWHQAYGVANAELGVPLAENAMFESASLTKPVFAYAVLKLVDAGVISLDVPLHRYLLEPVDDEQMKQITARMVLAHTTGFQNEVMPGQKLAIHFTPGSRFSYSGAGFLYLERVVEHVTGKALTPLMRDLVFTPLGMRDSGYVWIPEYETREVYGHTAGGGVAERRKPSSGTIATLHTTPLDYARFMIAIMKGSDLRSATVTAMLSTQSQVDPECVMCLTKTSGRLSQSLSWGLGWAVERSARGTAFWHWGENNGEFQNFAMGYLDGDGIVIFTNSGNGFSIMPEIVEAVLGGPHPAFAWMGYERYDAPGKLFLRDIRARGAAVALAGPAVDALTESQINSIGYALLQQRRVADAVLIFERNASRFPRSANVYDSLGEAYAAAGNREKAIANYRRSLELDPKNANAEAWLEKLGRAAD
jgi:CubicO group peptidase (beta-lactamase class C family)